MGLPRCEEAVPSGHGLRGRDPGGALSGSASAGHPPAGSLGGRRSRQLLLARELRLIGVCGNPVPLAGGGRCPTLPGSGGLGKKGTESVFLPAPVQVTQREGPAGPGMWGAAGLTCSRPRTLGSSRSGPASSRRRGS